jgi:hypothetical protein
LLGVLKPAILETDVHLSQLPQSLSEMRLINTKHPLMRDWLSAMSQEVKTSRFKKSKTPRVTRDCVIGTGTEGN